MELNMEIIMILKRLKGCIMLSEFDYLMLCILDEFVDLFWQIYDLDDKI